MRCLVLFSIFLISFNASSRKPISASRLEKLSGVKHNEDTKTTWDMRYSKRSFIYGKSPAKFLAENYEFIPHASSVLDIGMGEGRNAVFLAQKGYKVTGIDISSVAIKKARILAKEYNISIQAIVASVEKYKFQPKSFDAIIVFYYVDRSLIEKIKSWLKPNGIIIYEAHTIKQRNKPGFKNDPIEYFLKEQELLTMFKGMKVLKYEEPEHGKEYRASIIVQKLN